jgi:hypothetical protein
MITHCIILIGSQQMTSLFPETGVIEIHQSSTGDCYLLAALDGLLNTLPGGLEKIKAMFTATPDGAVIFRLKRSELSPNLRADTIRLNYGYDIDCSTDEDVFTVGSEKLKEIDEGISVRTNSLAVKIIERISSYYFPNKFELDGSYYITTPQDFVLDFSFVRHGERSFKAYSSAEFVALLFGFHSVEINLKQAGELIKLSAQQAIYVSMSYGKVDAYGKQHGRHALRLHSMSADTFTLINPWNTTKKEHYSAADLERKSPKFYIFGMDSNDNTLSLLLTKCSGDQAR